MAKFERSIKLALNKSSGEILEADEVFGGTKNAHNIREQYQRKDLLLSCCECDQELIVSKSKNNRLYFKHRSGHGYCLLSNDQLSPEDHEKITEILISKESDRHKELKNKIGTLLQTVDGIDKESISIDKRFIIRGNEKRRPDVYCKYQNKELVFEIQLSDLSLAYILNRYEFYKKHGMYLIWILDDFDIHNQGTLELDIKYLTKFENYFKLDETSETFHLVCNYKSPFLTYDNKLHSKWQTVTIKLDQLSWDEKVFQAYYYNYASEKERLSIELNEKVNLENTPLIKLIKTASSINDIFRLFTGGYVVNMKEKEYLHHLYNCEILKAESITRDSWQINIVWAIIFIKLREIELIKRLINTNNLSEIVFHILSIKLNIIFVYNYKNHKQIANKVLQDRKEYLDIFFKAVNKHRPELFKTEDQKGKLAKTLNRLMNDKPDQKTEDYDILKLIFPELFQNHVNN